MQSHPNWEAGRKGNVHTHVQATIRAATSGVRPQAIAEFDAAQLDRLTEARAAQVTALADDGVWTTATSSSYPETTCAINASAISFIESVEGPDGNFVRSLVVQTNSDIHNPYVFVGVTIGVYTDVFDNKNVVLTSFYHEAFAGAVLDPMPFSLFWLVV